jgi:hypothetical protein
VNLGKLEDNLAQTRHQQLVLTRAFETASDELGIGPGSLDVWKSERLGQILDCLAHAGVWDADALAKKAVASFLSETMPALGPNPERSQPSSMQRSS